MTRHFKQPVRTCSFPRAGQEEATNRWSTQSSVFCPFDKHKHRGGDSLTSGSRAKVVKWYKPEHSRDVSTEGYGGQPRQRLPKAKSIEPAVDRGQQIKCVRHSQFSLASCPGDISQQGLWNLFPAPFSDTKPPLPFWKKVLGLENKIWGRHCWWDTPTVVYTTHRVWPFTGSGLCTSHPMTSSVNKWSHTPDPKLPHTKNGATAPT